MTIEERFLLAAAAAVLLLGIFIAIWFLPQKWAVCQKLYDNRAAQIICLSSK